MIIEAVNVESLRKSNTRCYPDQWLIKKIWEKDLISKIWVRHSLKVDTIMMDSAIFWKRIQKIVLLFCKWEYYSSTSRHRKTILQVVKPSSEKYLECRTEQPKTCCLNYSSTIQESHEQIRLLAFHYSSEFPPCYEIDQLQWSPLHPS